MIGVFDSGSGGLSVLRELLKVLPDERYVYYADSAFCPYGDRTAAYVTQRARTVTRFLLDKGADIIVVACNTATAAAINTLRGEFPDTPFVGMEPAVKPAAKHSRGGIVGVLATAGTLKGSKYVELCEQYNFKADIVEHVGRGFVELVERGVTQGPEAEAVVRAAVEPLLNAGADCIVLGCTHYPFLEKTIREVAGDGVEIINPAPAVANQVKRLYKRTSPDEQPGVELCSSGDVTVLKRLYNLYLGNN